MNAIVEIAVVFGVQANFSGNRDIFEHIVPEQDFCSVYISQFVQDVVEKLDLGFHIANVSGGERAVELAGKAHLVQDIFRAVLFLVRCKVTGDAALAQLLCDLQKGLIGAMLAGEPVVQELVHCIVPVPLRQVKGQLLLEIGFSYQAIAEWPPEKGSGDIHRNAVIARQPRTEWLVR